MKLATTTSDFCGFGGHKYPTIESMRYIHQSGFRYLDYGFSYSNPEAVFTDEWKKHIENVKNTAKELSLEFVQAHAPMASSPSMPIDADNDQFIADNIRCIECCAELGIKNIVVHSGYRLRITKEEFFEQNKKFYKKLLPAAEKFGVNILTENFTQMHHEANTYWTDAAKDLKELVDYVDHPMLHVCWDIGHANSTDIPQDESLRILANHVKAIHVQDNLGITHPLYGNTDPHMAPFFGSVNFDSVMHGLSEIGYEGAFTLETGIFYYPIRYKKPYDKDDRLQKPLPLDIKLDAEKLLYKLSKHILETYDCFEG